MAEETKKTARTRKNAATNKAEASTEVVRDPGEEARILPQPPAGDSSLREGAGEEKDALEEMRAAYEEKLAAMQAEMQKQLETMKEAMLAAQKPSIIQVAADTEKVQFLWMAQVCDENIYEVGPGGMYARLVGKGPSRFLVPKSELSRAMDTMFRQLMDCRWIIVLSGLTDEERKVYGVDYRPGEYLDEMAFTRMVEQGDKMLDIYPLLCDGHKEMVEKSYYEAWKEKHPQVTRELVMKLKSLAADAGRTENAFKRIILEMNEADAKE